MENLRIVASWLAVLGVPSIFTMIAGVIVAIRKLVRHIDILQKAQKAQMRSQMIRQYEEYMDQGYIQNIHLDDWMNQYKAYHELVGDNDVLDARKDTLIALPNRPTIHIHNHEEVRNED